MKDRDYSADDRLAGLFQPDTLLPSQFFDRVRRRSEHDGERRLMIAVLEDAIDVYRKQAGRCPACGAAVAGHVQEAQAREERIERVVAVVGSALVLLVFALTAGLGLVEGVLAYAAAGAAVFFLAKRTFH